MSLSPVLRGQSEFSGPGAAALQRGDLRGHSPRGWLPPGCLVPSLVLATVQKPPGGHAGGSGRPGHAL